MSVPHSFKQGPESADRDEIGKLYYGLTHLSSDDLNNARSPTEPLCVVLSDYHKIEFPGTISGVNLVARA
jgi:hypothetical protein